jgi:predicted O-methyltransferase YrrM
MSPRTLGLTDKLYDYVIDATVREHPVLARLREATARMPGAGMQISPDQGQFMGFLARLIGVRRAIEVGTYTGYSALAVALALPDDGKLICCDVNAETTRVGQRFWGEAGVAGRIDLRIAPAIETLDALLAAGEADRFDMVFIDADKPAYDAYYERALRLLRTGGLIVIDNVLWDGAVADPKDKSASTKALRALNAKIRDDQRVDCSLVTIGDGVMLARKR